LGQRTIDTGAVVDPVKVDIERGKPIMDGPFLRAFVVLGFGANGHRFGPTFPPTQFIKGGIGGHAVQPRGESAGAIEFVNAFGDGNQGILGGIGRIGFVVGYAAGDGCDVAVMLA
jgi:hypothetical protein